MRAEVLKGGRRRAVGGAGGKVLRIEVQVEEHTGRQVPPNSSGGVSLGSR